MAENDDHLVIGVAFALWLREPRVRRVTEPEATYRSLAHAAGSAIRGAIPGVRTIFLATLLLQMTFQTFTTWYALYGTERFLLRPEDVTIGFIAWAAGAVLGSFPGGLLASTTSPRRCRSSRSRPRVGPCRWRTPIRCSSSRFQGSTAASSPPCSSWAWPIMAGYTALGLIAVLCVP